MRRSALPGVALVIAGVVCLLFSGGWGGSSGGGALLVLGGLVGISAGIFLLALPACVTVLTAGAGPRVRRSPSGSAAA